MSKRCQVTGKVPITGCQVSHAHNVSLRRFLPNLQKKRFWYPEEKRWVTLSVSARGIKTITRKGLHKVVLEMRRRGEAV